MPTLRHLLRLALILVTVTWNSGSAQAGRPPPLVYVNKCCRFGEYMDINKTCVVGGSKQWFPTVFMIAKKAKFTPRGEYPRFFRINENSLPKVCSNPEHFVNKTIVIFSNGTLFLFEKSVSVALDNYCADQNSALVCLPQVNNVDSLLAPKKLSMVKKCCLPNSVYYNQTCSAPKKDGHLAPILNSADVEIIYGFPDCNNTHIALLGKFQDKFLNQETGQLTLDSGKVLESSDFCLERTSSIQSNDTVSDKESVLINMFACSKHFSVPESAPEINHHVQVVLYSVGLLISVIFLSATLAAGFLMPSNHHVLHWRCQTYYVACLLVGDLLQAITRIAGNDITGVGCVLIANFMHFSFLAAFFWLNTMCFNIWWTFRDFRPTSLEKGQELFRLRIYRVYAWGIPLLIAGVAAILDNIPESSSSGFLRPRFGEERCWFGGDSEIRAYFFAPIGVLLFINALLFLSTARQLTCGLWKRDDVKSTTERAALGRVCLKLVIVMGVTWLADILSWVIGGPESAWYFTDVINTLQGVFIFVVVGCQPQVWTALKRIWSSKTGRGVTTATNGPQHSSSSHGLPSIGDTVTNNTLTNTTSTKVPMETVC